MRFRRGIAAALALTCALSLPGGGVALADETAVPKADSTDSAEMAAASDGASSADDAADGDSAAVAVADADDDPAADPEAAQPGEREVAFPSLMRECIPQTIEYWSSYANSVVYDQIIKPIEDQRLAEKRERVFKKHEAARKKYMKKQVKKAQEKARQAEIEAAERQEYSLQAQAENGSSVSVGDVDAAALAAIAASAPEGKLTMADLMACSSRAQLIHLLASVYAKYAAQYGIRYPGVFAVQTVYETLSGIGSGGAVANCAYKDNNLSGLKYTSKQAAFGATPGITSSEGDRYAHFPSVEDYIAYAMYFVGTSDMHAPSRARQDSVENFTAAYVSLWWMGVPDISPDVSYAHLVIDDFHRYGVAAYNVW